MKASFFEFNVASTGLFTAKNAINVVAHNIANAKTEGYSRQVALLRTSQPLTFRDGRGMVGTGSEVYGVGQIRSAHLDRKYWNQNSVLGEHQVKTQQLNLTESIFNSLSETGLTGTINAFFSSLSDLTTTADDTTYRANVLQIAETFAKQVNNTYESLAQQQIGLNEEIRATVSIVNGIGSQIKSLNQQISRSEMDGSNANDLRDRRASLIDELSQYANVDVKEVTFDRGSGVTEKRLVLKLNGTDFVNHDSMNSLGVVARREARNPDDAVGLYDIVWTGSAETFDMYSSDLKGELKAMIDLRDGNNGHYMQSEMGVNGIEAKPSATDPTYYEITLPDPSKMDLQASGKISFIDKATNKKIEFSYSNLEKAADGSYTLRIPASEMSPAQAEKFNAEGTVAQSGETCSYKGIPYYLERMNELVRNLARAMNEGLDAKGDKIPGVVPHSEGYDVRGDNYGYYLFTYKDALGKEQLKPGDPDDDEFPDKLDYMKFTAKNFQVSSFLKEKPQYIAASADEAAGPSNNEVILSFSNIKNYDSLFREGGVVDYTISVMSSIGIDLKQSSNFEKNYTDVITGIQNQRLSVMGVDVDEETLNLIKYNELLQASAKMINIIDQIYNTVINLGA